MVEEVMLERECKQTEFGEIPNDWDYKPIGKEIDLLTGFPFSSNKYSSDGIKLLRGSNVKRGILDWSESLTKYWTAIVPEIKQYLLQEGDIIIAMDGSLVGKSYARISVSDLPALLLQRVARVRSNKIDIAYLKEFICSDFFTKHCNNVKTTSAIPHISPLDIRSFSIPIPPTKTEQNAIAVALNDIDSFIVALEKLIAKKRVIKQGIVQEFLSGKKRLKSYADKWTETALTKVCWFQEGPGLRNWQFTNSGIKAINVTNLENGYLNLSKTDRYISNDLYNRMYKHFTVDEGDVVIASSGNSYGKVAVVRRKDLPLLMNTSVIRFKPLKNLDYKFLLSFLKSSLFKDQIDLLVTGGAQPNFGPAHLKKIMIKVPATIEEQREIANKIASIESEIHETERKAAKYKRLKQGMMQNLLTGKIRLI